MYKLVVLFCFVAVAVAKPSVLAPLTYSAVVPGVSSLSQYSTSVVHGSPFYGPSVYRSFVPALYAPTVAHLSQAPNSPAVVLDAHNGVPLDTPEVVAARAEHYHAKALAGVHHLRKRSVVAPVTYSSVVSPLGYSAPLVTSPYVSTYSSPIVSPYAYSLYPKALSYHPW